MAAAEDIAELEKSISDFSKAVLTAKVSLPAARKDVQRTKEVFEAERAALNVAQSNLRHMKGPADLVVLAEFVEVTMIALKKREAVTWASIELAKAQTKLNTLERNIPIMEAALATWRKSLKDYGRIYNFVLP